MQRNLSQEVDGWSDRWVTMIHNSRHYTSSVSPSRSTNWSQKKCLGKVVLSSKWGRNGIWRTSIQSLTFNIYLLPDMINLKLLPVISYITSQVGYENGHAYQWEDVKMKWHPTLSSQFTRECIMARGKNY